MKRFKAAFKAAKVPAIVGIIGAVIAIVFVIIGLVLPVDVLFWVGVVLILVAVACFVIAYGNFKKRMHAICPECEKFMGVTTGVVNYSYVCTDFRHNYGGDGAGGKKYIDTTFVYTCTIDCPHCGSTHTFEYKTRAKTQSAANVNVDNYLKNILKLSK